MAPLLKLLHPEGLAVGALVFGGVSLVGANQDAVQGAVICVGAVVSALLNGAFNAFVGMAVHNVTSFFRDDDSMAQYEKNIQKAARWAALNYLALISK